MLNDKVYFGLVQNLIAFPGWRGETREGLEISKRLLNDPFFEMVEMGWVENPEYRRTLIHSVAACGKEVTYGCGPVIFGEQLDLNSRDSGLRKKTVERIKQLADDALDYNAKVLLIAGGNNVEKDKKGEAMRLLVDSLEQICGFCADIRPDSPLVVSHELFDWDIDKKLLLGPIDDSILIAKRIVKDHPNFSLTLDLSHLPLMRETSENAVKRCMPFMQHVHIGNCVLRDRNHPKHGDKHPCFGIDGSEVGRIQLQEFLEVLDENGYGKKRTPTRRPVVVAEVIPGPDDDIDMVIENIKQAIMP